MKMIRPVRSRNILVALSIVVSLCLTLQVASCAFFQQANPCKPKNVTNGIVCVCNKDYCDDLQVKWPQAKNTASLIETNRGGLRFAQRTLKQIEKPRRAVVEDRVEIDINRKYQEIMGWGGAFTDSTGINIAALSDGAAEKLMQSLYGPKGLSYNFGRVPIGGADFSARGYTYDDSDEPDYELKKWQLAREDMDYKIPYIKRAKELVEQRGDKLKLFGSPWSAPAWMKTSNNLIGGQLKKDNQTRTAYTEYLMKFYDAYREFGIEFWGATVQNEPMISWMPDGSINSMPTLPVDLAEFVADYLGPALHARNMTRDKFKLMFADENLGLTNMIMEQMMNNNEASKYVAGIAYHWYFSGYWTSHWDLDLLYNKHKDQVEFILMTEACTGADRTGVRLGDWDRGNRYAHDIIRDLQHHTGGWIDWNMALDEQGGPNWCNNFVDSPIVVNAKLDEFYKQPMYYALGHFSRTFLPGSTRVYSHVVGDDYYDDQSRPMDVVAVRKGKYLVVNILNKSNQERQIHLNIKGDTKRAFQVTAESINTFILAVE